jgi:hypothetical protein
MPLDLCGRGFRHTQVGDSDGAGSGAVLANAQVDIVSYEIEVLAVEGQSSPAPS